MKKTRKFVSIFAILFALVFALSVCFFAACGNKDDEKDNDTTTEQDGDTGSGDTGSGDTGSGDIGSGDTGSGDTGSGDTGSGDTGSGDTGSGDTGSGDTGSGDIGSGDTGSGDTGSGDTGSGDTGSGDTGSGTVVVSTADELTTALSGTDEIVLGATISDATETFTVSSDTTIDLAGYSITSTPEKGGATITVTSTGSLTVKDSSDAGTGSIACTYTHVNSADNAAAILTSGKLVLDGGTVTSTSTGINAQGGEVTINNATVDTTSGWWAIFENTGTLSDSSDTATDVTVTINDGAVVTGNQKTIYLAGDSDGYSSVYNSTTVSKLIVEGGTITGQTESAISTRGLTTKDCAVVEINGGTITGTTSNRGPAVYIPNGELTITNGAISGSTAVEIRGGTATISGGTFTSTYNGTPEATYTTSGATSIGYALAVYPYTSTNRDSDSNFDNTVDVKVTGGTFTGNLYKNITREGDSFTITGGSFSENPQSYLTGHFVATQVTEDNKTYYVVGATEAATVSGFITADGYVAGEGHSSSDTFGTSKVELYSAEGTSVSFYGSSNTADDGTTPKTKITSSSRTSTDGYHFTYAIQLDTKASMTDSAPQSCIEVVATGACTLTVYMMSSNSETARTVNVWKGSIDTTNKVGDDYTAVGNNGTFNPITIELSEAGTYYIGTTSSALNFYGMLVTYAA